MKYAVIDWYCPRKLTRGLMVGFLRALIEDRLFSWTSLEETHSPDIHQLIDKAA
jgi:hypothetical protein